MGCVRANVAALVVAVQGEVQAEAVDEAWVVTGAQHGGKVLRPVLANVDGRKGPARLERVDVNLCCDGGELSQQRDAVVECGFPVVGLVHTLCVGLGKFRVVIEGGDTVIGFSHPHTHTPVQ